MSEIIVNKPLTLGKILDKCLNFIFRNILWITFIGFFIEFPQILFTDWMGSHIQEFSAFKTRLFSGIIYTILTPFLSGTVALLLGAQFTGNPLTWYQGLGKTLKKLFPLLILQFFVGFSTILGSALFIIPGIIVTCATVCALPAIMLEHLGPTKAFDRSWNLTKGSRWRIFGYVIVSMIIMGLVGGISAAISINLPMEPLYSLGLMALITAPTHALWPAMSTFIYFDLRIRKEALDLEEAVVETSVSN